MRLGTSFGFSLCFKMAEGFSQDVLEEIFSLDLTDDDFFEELGNFEMSKSVEEEENSQSNRFDQINGNNLAFVLQRLSDVKCNIEKEATIATKILNTINNTEADEQIESFLSTIQTSFSVFYDSVKIKKKQEREIRIERKFFDSSSEERKKIEQKWNEIICSHKICKSQSSDAILEHILLHFWAVRQTSVEQHQPEIGHLKTKTTNNKSELEAIKYHGGWSVKRARDQIKSIADAKGKLLLKQSKTNDTEVAVDPKHALELIKILGYDEKVGDKFCFAIHPEVIEFFILLHDFVDNYFAMYSIDDEVIINCLRAMSVHVGIRVAWETICKKAYPIAVQVAVLQRVVTMFIKSKQQIIREKLNLKPQKGSLALRQEIKKPKAKKSNPTETSTCKTPDIVKKLQDNSESPDIIIKCLEEIGQTFT